MKPVSKLISLSIMSSIAISCGQTDEREEASSTSLSSSETVSSESVSTSLADALEALSDSSSSSNSSTLALQGNGSRPTIERSRSCLEDGTSAQVTLEKSISGSVEFTTRFATITRELSGSGTTIRTWSQGDTAVLCDSSNSYADIDWDGDISNLSLSLSFDRSKSSSNSRVRTSDGSETTRTKQQTASGSRTITWISHTDNDDGTFTRVKSVSSSVTRTNEVSSSNSDNNVSLSLTVETVDGEELNVTSLRDATSYELQTKLISTGSLRASDADSSYVVTSFEDYLISFEDGECTPTSGKLTANFYEDGSDTAVKTLEVSVDNGSYTLMDITDPDNPEEVTDFDYDLCYAADFQ